MKVSERAPFSNRDRQVFVLNMESELDRGALLSRYSRTSSLDIRDLYEKEFENNPLRGREFYQRVFLEYGDESVAELVTAQVAVQDISNVVSKIIEESRTGLSFLEKSSRYVSYSKKREGKYLYLDFNHTGIDPSLEREYVDLMDNIFKVYSECIEPLQKEIKLEYPLEVKEGVDPLNMEKAYNSAVRARALDDIRSILPCATLTNVGISGNIRAFIYLIQRLYASGIAEADKIATMLLEELSKDFNELLKSARGKYGDQNIDYLSKIKHSWNTESVGKKMNLEPESNLLAYSRENLEMLPVIFTSQNGGSSELTMPEIIRIISQNRKNRRNKLPRELEFISLTYRINMNYGAFREFQRHRFMSIIRKEVGMDNGFQTPEFVTKTPGMLEKYIMAMQSAKTLWEKVVRVNGKTLAQYVVPFGAMYSLTVATNLRELVYFCELRSTPQSHPDLRALAIQMMREIVTKEPVLEPLFVFVDQGDYPLGRFDQEYKKEIKLRELGKGTE